MDIAETIGTTSELEQKYYLSQCDGYFIILNIDAGTNTPC